jgi:hypothetical protein
MHLSDAMVDHQLGFSVRLSDPARRGLPWLEISRRHDWTLLLALAAGK